MLNARRWSLFACRSSRRVSRQPSPNTTQAKRSGLHVTLCVACALSTRRRVHVTCFFFSILGSPLHLGFRPSAYVSNSWYQRSIWTRAMAAHYNMRNNNICRVTLSNACKMLKGMTCWMQCGIIMGRINGTGQHMDILVGIRQDISQTKPTLRARAPDRVKDCNGVAIETQWPPL